MARAVSIADRLHNAWSMTMLGTVLPLALALASPAACEATKTPAQQTQSAPSAPSPDPAPASTAAAPPVEKREEAKAPAPAPAPAPEVAKPAPPAEVTKAEPPAPPPAEPTKKIADAAPAPTPVPAPAPAPEVAKPAPAEVTKAEPAPPPAPTRVAEATPPPAEPKPEPAPVSPPPIETPKPTAEAPAPAPTPAPEVTPPAPKPAADATPPAPTPAPAPASGTRDEVTSPPPAPTTADTNPAEPPKPTSRFSLFGKPVRTWAILLQNPDPETIARTPYDVVVIEYSRDGSEETAFTKEEVAKMKRKPDGSERILIAYMSIGEAESYRYYWAKNGWSKKANRPSWLMKENPEWLGNYTIKFWSQGWKDIIYDKPGSYLDKLIDAGFDGAYLDKIDITDVLEDYTPKGENARDLMIKFIQGISKKANARTGDRFALVASNAEPMLDIDEYRNVMHAIGKEDLFFNSQFDGKKLVDGFPNDPEAVNEQIRLCKKLVDDKKLVLAVEYLDSKPELIPPTAKKHLALGHIPYFGPRDLARLSGTTYAQAAKVGARGLSMSVRKASACNTLDESACGKEEGCIWMRGYDAGEVTVPGYCRIAPSATVQRLGVEKRE